jgi:hypothetical protein
VGAAFLNSVALRALGFEDFCAFLGVSFLGHGWDYQLIVLTSVVVGGQKKKENERS